jgi:hypothetical protein
MKTRILLVITLIIAIIALFLPVPKAPALGFATSVSATNLSVANYVTLTNASGSASFTGATSSKVVTHSLGVAPTRILISVRGCPGTSTSNITYNMIYVDITTANTTAFTLYSAATTNQTTLVDWIALK